MSKVSPRSYEAKEHAESYDREKAWYYINHSILSGLLDRSLFQDLSRLMVPWLVSTVLSTISDMVANGYLLLHKKVGPSQVSEPFDGKVFLAGQKEG
jgi:hypothetical protein